MNPDYVETHYNLGVVYTEKTRYGRRIHHLHLAVKSDPNYSEESFDLRRLGNTPASYAEFHNDLGKWFSEQGDDEKSMCHYRKPLELAPHNSNATANRRNYLNGTNKISFISQDPSGVISVKTAPEQSRISTYSVEKNR